MEHGKVGVRGRLAPHRVGREKPTAHETVCSPSITVCLVTAVIQSKRSALMSIVVRHGGEAKNVDYRKKLHIHMSSPLKFFGIRYTSERNYKT